MALSPLPGGRQGPDPRAPQAAGCQATRDGEGISGQCLGSEPPAHCPTVLSPAPSSLGSFSKQFA